MTHTPGPWKIVTYNNGKGMAIEDEKGNDVLTKSNAQFIVTACNAHKELVDLLRQARYYLKPDYSLPCTDLINKIDATLTTIEKGA